MIKQFYVCGARFNPLGRCWFNGIKGSLWQGYILHNGSWIFIAQGFIGGYRPTRSDVIGMMEGFEDIRLAMKPVGDA